MSAALVVALTAGCDSSASGGAAATSPAGTPTSPASSSAPTASAGPVSSGAVSSSGESSGGASSGAVSSTRPAVPPPTPGSIEQTVASQTVRTSPPVGLHAKAAFGTGVSVRLARLSAITAKAQGPGEIGGPAIELALRFANATGRRVDVRQVIVNVAGSDGTPGLAISGAPADPVSGYLAAGSTTVGTYVFTLEKSKRTPITIDVSYLPGTPVVQIVGNAD